MTSALREESTSVNIPGVGLADRAANVTRGKLADDKLSSTVIAYAGRVAAYLAVGSNIVFSGRRRAPLSRQ